jgi:hypothetical protein
MTFDPNAKIGTHCDPVIEFWTVGHRLTNSVVEFFSLA